MVSDWIFEEMDFAGVYCIHPFKAGDERGDLTKWFSNDLLARHGVNFKMQEVLVIESKKNVLRGIHFQKEKPVAKLISCISGRIYVVIIDVRKGSKNLGKWISCDLKADMQLFVPAGYGVGTYAMEYSILLCMNDEKMYPKLDDGIKWNDSTIAVKWPCKEMGNRPVISLKDEKLQSFHDYVIK